MRDDDTSRQLPQTEVQQPDPMLDEQRPGPLRIGVTMLAAAAVVVLVMYGLSRPTEPPTQTVNAPEASQTTGQATPQAPQGTTGQGQAQTENQQQQTQQGQGKSPRADSATTGQASAPSDKAAPPPKK